MTDRFKHVQRPIMINDCDVSIKEPRDSPSPSLLFSSQAKQQCYGSLCFRFDSFGERFTGLVTSFFFVIFASISRCIPVGGKRRKVERYEGEAHNDSLPCLR